jgi:tripartite-type tricarboxylate transporter receptor subunit TctC
MITKDHATRRALVAGAAALAAALACSSPAAAQPAYPTRTIRVIVPFPAGGTTDLLARLFAQRLGEGLGQSVIVENMGGAGGSVGADAVAKAEPDGHTLLFHNLTFSTTTASLEFAGRAKHGLADFAPVSLAAERTPTLPDVPTVRELGFPNMELRGWNGFFAPARTPEPIVARLQQEIAKAAQHPDVRRRAEEVGAEPVGSTPAELGRIVREQIDKVRPLVAELKLVVQ